MVSTLLDYATAYDRDDVRFRFKDGTEIKVGLGKDTP
jgi:hypothetical protein